MTRLARCLRVALLVPLVLFAAATAALDCAPLPERELGAHERHQGAQSLFWRIRAANGAESLLFGTVHLADPRLAGIVARAEEEALARDTFVMEVVLDAAAILALQGAMFYLDGSTLAQSVGGELAARAGDLMAPYGIPEEMVSLMKPWAVFTTLSAPPSRDGVAMDLRLMLAVSSAGKTVRGLETAAEQVAVFESISLDEQRDMLREAVCHHDLLQAEVDRLVAHYAEQDLAGLTETSLRHVDETREAFMDALLGKRNRLMLERLVPILEQGDAFIAIGALHLPGRDGVLAGLRARGFTVDAAR